MIYSRFQKKSLKTISTGKTFSFELLGKSPRIYIVYFVDKHTEAKIDLENSCVFHGPCKTLLFELHAKVLKTYQAPPSRHLIHLQQYNPRAMKIY